ncbi:HAD family hydrolase [Myceligenerans pegani]|uniref:HAD-IIB family hydrolase n=1 Tax=Myceligenerans pegani TaxID=2776917 RepID=A0ABR9MY62_9MICO|nr:HAD-IIB family hydrolase [Myceligenerans sp. TRM 65318]MBE1875996.1 HAD-IIB family hydrolase [Myceligenerans sp. TRM 65318]MBE3018267.1 HAD-IIB family hydrolase [Myceligenerans sp. TRM 65318]
MNDTTTSSTATTAASDNASSVSAKPAEEPMQISLDVDGTIVADGTIDVPPVTADAVQDVLAVGHHIVLASGRSLVGLLPVAARLGLVTGWLVASNGAVTARLTPRAPGGYEITNKATLQVAPVVDLVRQFTAETAIAVEEIGVGYHVTRQFEPGLLNGRQTVVAHDLLPEATPRLVLHAPGITDTLLPHLRALDVTATPAGESWIDISPSLFSKGTALYRVRRRLGVHPDRTVAIGDSINDIPAFKWAAIGVAMGDAPAVVRAAADITTGTLQQHGAASVLEAIAAGKPVTELGGRAVTELADRA